MRATGADPVPETRGRCLYRPPARPRPRFVGRRDRSADRRARADCLDSPIHRMTGPHPRSSRSPKRSRPGSRGFCVSMSCDSGTCLFSGGLERRARIRRDAPRRCGGGRCSTTPTATRLVLVEQFRLPPVYAGCSPWQVEVVAGLVEPRRDATMRRPARDARGGRARGDRRTDPDPAVSADPRQLGRGGDAVSAAASIRPAPAASTASPRSTRTSASSSRAWAEIEAMVDAARSRPATRCCASTGCCATATARMGRLRRAAGVSPQLARRAALPIPVTS